MTIYEKMKYIKEVKDTTRFKNAAVNKFEHLLIKCLQTTFVGALSAFEKEFGDLWGQDEVNLTKEQKAFKARWKRVRTNIFDLGNNQIDFAQKQLNIFLDKNSMINNKIVRNERWKENG